MSVAELAGIPKQSLESRTWVRNSQLGKQGTPARFGVVQMEHHQMKEIAANQAMIVLGIVRVTRLAHTGWAGIVRRHRQGREWVEQPLLQDTIRTGQTRKGND